MIEEKIMFMGFVSRELCSKEMPDHILNTIGGILYAQGHCQDCGRNDEGVYLNLFTSDSYNKNLYTVLDFRKHGRVAAVSLHERDFYVCTSKGNLIQMADFNEAVEVAYRTAKRARQLFLIK